MPHGCSQAWSGILCACLQGSLGPEGPESLADPRTTRKRATGSTKDLEPTPAVQACCAKLGFSKGMGFLQTPHSLAASRILNTPWRT